MEGYLSEDDNSINSGSSSDDYKNKQEDTSADFGTRYQNKQVQTLKYLRHALSVNKSLKQRLEIVESELEKYQDFGSYVLPVNDQPEVKHQSTLTEPEVEPISQTIIEVKLVKTEEKFCQSDFQIVEKEENLNFFMSVTKTKTPEPKPQIIDKIELPIEKEITKISIACQSEDDPRDKEKIVELTSLINSLKSEHQAKIETLNLRNEELKLKCDGLDANIGDLKKSLNLSNEKLSEYIKKNLNLDKENEELVEIKQKFDLMLVENEQLYSEMDLKQTQLNDSNKKFFELNESLNQSLDLVEKQKILIKSLEAENEKNLKEKHVICQQKISDLTAQCHEYKERLEKFEVENKSLNELLTDSNKQVERYKADLKNFNFKEFVSLKRELNSLKQEKERQFANKVTMPCSNLKPESQSPLPPIKPLNKNLFNFFN